MKSLKEQAAELEVSKPQDYDPEELEPFPQNGDNVSSDEERIDKASRREHYEEVGKSRLREPASIALGKQYGGAAVTRDALDALSDDDDPFAPAEDGGDVDPFARRDDLEDNNGSAFEAGDLALEGSDIHDDEEIDSNEAFGDSDEEKFRTFKFFGSKSHEFRNKAGLLDDSMEDLEVGDSGLASEDEKSQLSNDETDAELQDAESDIEDGLEDESESETSPAPVSNTKTPSTDREKLKALLSNDAAAVASSLATAASDDAKKGRAVRQQCETFDRFLDSRIKLQKGLNASNGLDVSTITDEDASTAVRKAEEAALGLWSTLESLRLTMQAASATGKDIIAKKRKISHPISVQTAPADLWKRMHSLETVALPHRRTILNKWSAKTRTANTAPRSQLLSSSQQANQNQITAVIDSYLATESAKQVAAATSSAAKSTTLFPTYTDIPFYESLLRDLVASRSQSQHQQYSQSQLTVPTKLHQTQRRTQVDTKASKGRKVRYTVHEKLQNFAAAEDRSTWGEAARVEFFASLFGGAGRLALEEDNDEDMEESEAEGEALRLFRS